MGSEPIRWRAQGPPASRLLVDVAAGRPVEAARSLTPGELALVRHHGLLSLLAHSPLPALREPALFLYLEQAGRQHRMLEHLGRVLRSLWEAGVQATVVKGPYVAAHYPDAALRTFADLDLLVPREELEEALEVLAADPFVRGIPPKRPKADKRDVPFREPSGFGFHLDLHWDLFSYTQLHRCAEGAVPWAWSRAKPDPHHPLGPLWHLPEEALTAFLCTHAVLDHRFRLILFRDLAEVAPRGTDWKRLVAFAERWRLRSWTYLALLVAARRLDAPVPEEVLARLRPSHLPARLAERLLPRTDLVTFDGHRPHPLNLAVVLSHDQPAVRARLVARAPLAFPDWRQRVARQREARRRVAAVVVTTDRRRGAEVFGERLAEGLRRRGWSVDFLALSTAGRRERVAAVPLSHHPPEGLGRLRPGVVLALRRRIAEQRPEVVFANGSATLRYAVAALAGRRRRPRLVYGSIGDPLYWSSGPLRRRMQRLLLGRLDSVLAVSEHTRRRLVGHYVLDPARVHVVHTGVPASFFEVEPAAGGEGLRLVTIGSLSPEKAPEVALELLAEVRRRRPARLRVVGEGPLEADLRRRARRLDVEEAVEFTGPVEDVRPHLAWADLHVLTSRTEGLPGVVLEAGAAGVPTVAFDVGGTRESLVDGETGLLVPPGDLGALVEAVLSLADHPERLRSMGEAARRFVRERFELDGVIDRYQELLRAPRPVRGGGG